ncbi:hypothetical protein ACGFIE_30385 [Micromonospora sp. NPDC049275]|uniref:hypothetical protein n=1 Tax=Micromonospora sp. NPDC049275 TaxID=3364268 RepID=UPI003717CC42
MLLRAKRSVQEFGEAVTIQAFVRASSCYVGGMARSLNVAYLLTLLTLVVVGLVWDAPTGVKVLVGGAAMIPVVVADVVLWRRGRAVRVADTAR